MSAVPSPSSHSAVHDAYTQVDLTPDERAFMSRIAGRRPDRDALRASYLDDSLERRVEALRLVLELGERCTCATRPVVECPNYREGD